MNKQLLTKIITLSSLFFLNACPVDPKDNFPVNYIKIITDAKKEATVVKSALDNFSGFNSSLETPVIATNSSGTSIVAWVDDKTGTKDVYAMRMDASGKPLGLPFQVNTTNSDSQNLPSVAINDNGEFIIAWTTKGQDGDGYGVYARRYNREGAYQGNEFKVNTSTARDQWIPAVAITNNGGSVVVWQSFGQDGNGYGIAGQRFDNKGNTLGPEFLINNNPYGAQEFPEVAMDSVGNFVVVWQSNQNNQGNPRYTDIYARKFKRDGFSETPELLVSTSIGENKYPSVAINDKNNFVVSWNAKEPENDKYDIYARSYVNSKPFGDILKVSKSNKPDLLSKPTVAIDKEGAFKIAWTTELANKLFGGLYLRAYNNSTQEVGTEEKLSSTGNTVLQPDMSSDKNGKIFVVWREY